jgi:glucose/arabinose dehydrogenase
MLRMLLLLTGAAALAACSSGASNEQAAAAKPAAQAASAPQKTVIDPQLKALQKAKDVQKTVDDLKQATDKAIDDQGG